MNFARKILQNYGWKDGDGLGKNNNGIAKPIKANLKFDNAGFGADQAADDFNNHWWERVFNEAATNVKVTHDGEKIKMKLKDEEDSVEISTKGYSTKKLKKLRKSASGNNSYSNFLPAATLTNLGDEIENRDKIHANSIEVSKVNVLSDEELFKACGGRTAHKGARHGLKLSGKLLRIEQQEAELFAKVMAKSNRIDDEKLTKLSTSEKIHKHEAINVKDETHKARDRFYAEGGKLKKKISQLSEVGNDETDTNIQDTCFNKTKRKKSANTKKEEREHNDELKIIVNIPGEKEHGLYIESKNKKCKLCEVASTEPDTNTPEMSLMKSKKKKKSKKMIERVEHIDVETSNMNIISKNDGRKIMSNEDEFSDNVKDEIKNKMKKKKKLNK